MPTKRKKSKKVKASGADQPRKLLYTRDEAARVLGCSVRQVMRIEKEFLRLKPIKLVPLPTAKTYYRVQDVKALARAQAAGARHG